MVYAVLISVGGNASELCVYIGLCGSKLEARSGGPLPKQWQRSRGGVQRTTRRKKKKATKTRRIVQFSDMHFDQYYAVGSSQNSPGYTMGCRSEFGYSAKPFSGPWGSYGAPGAPFGCDIPVAMLQSAFSSLGQLPYPIDAVVLSGDFVAHDIWQNNATEIASEVSLVTELLRDALPTLRNGVFFVLGNHDMFPADQFKLPQEGTQTNTQDLLNSYASLYGYLGSDVSDSIRAGGFYTTLMYEGMRLVSMNTQYGDMINFWLYAGQGTGGPDQFAWLNATLTAARANGESVVIAAHMPCEIASGIWDYYCLDFAAVVAEFTDIIVLMISGHTHRDSWVTFSALNVSLVQYVSPSLTTFSFKNPSYRVYTLEDDVVAQVDTYITDLSATTNGNAPVWQLEYSLPKAYGMHDLSAQSFDKVAKAMVTSDELWFKFNDYNSCSTPANITGAPCSTQACRIERFCRLTSATLALHAACLASHGVQHV